MKKAFVAASLDHLVRPQLSRILPPDKFVQVYSRTRTWFLDMLASCRPEAYVPQEKVNIHGVTFRNCLGNAAGLDKDGRLLAFNYLLGAGFAVVGTVLSEPYAGNLIRAVHKWANPWTPLPYSRSAINSLGLPSHGVECARENIVNFRRIFQPENFPIIASVMGHPSHKDEQKKINGILHCLQVLLPWVDGFEVNESCPNTEHSDKGLENRLRAVLGERDYHYERYGIYKPVLVKMRDVGNAEYTVKFLTKMGVDGVVLTNTQINYPKLRESVHPKDLPLFDYYTKTHKGGVSGPIIRAFAYGQVSSAVQAIEKQKSRMLVADVGGIETQSDIAHSRNLNPNIVKLHEWYTGKMNALGSQDPSCIYKDMIFGKTE